MAPIQHEPALPVASLSNQPIRPQGDDRPKPVRIRLKTAALVAGLHTDTCPQCGVNPAGPEQKRTFQYVPPWVYLGLLANVIVVLILIAVMRKTVHTKLNLCADCAAADVSGRKIQSLGVAGVIVLPILAAIGGAVAGVSGAAVAFLAASGLVGGLVGAVVASLRTRADTIECKRIDPKLGVVELSASPQWAEVIRREMPEALL